MVENLLFNARIMSTFTSYFEANQPYYTVSGKKKPQFSLHNFNMSLETMLSHTASGKDTIYVFHLITLEN